MPNLNNFDVVIAEWQSYRGGTQITSRFEGEWGFSQNVTTYAKICKIPYEKFTIGG